MNWLENTIALFSPGWAQSRAMARHRVAFLARHYEAANPSYRTSKWARTTGDADAVSRRAIAELRIHARDLVRNNAWASASVEVITSNTIGEGIIPACPDAQALALWRRWANTTACDAGERLTFAGIQEQVVRAVVTDGEVLVRRRFRRAEDKLPIPLALEVLEADFLDTSKDGIPGESGGFVRTGIEYDAIGRRAAYYLFDRHPGSQYQLQGSKVGNISRRVAATEVLHIFRPLRPGQSRGVSWLAQTVLPLKDFDKYEDAQLLKQQIAACFTAFVRDPNGQASPIGGTPAAATPNVEEMQPGAVAYLPPGTEVTFGTPPSITPDGFDVRTLRRIAAGMGITYEDLTGDYSQVNFSSGRMGRIKHQRNVSKWQWNLFIPQLCDEVWLWAMGAAVDAGLLRAVPVSMTWTPPAMPMIEPAAEAKAITAMIRAGLKTQSEAIREQGHDPEEFFAEYAADNAKLDVLKMKLDSDPRAVTQAGQVQMDPAKAGAASAPSAD